MLWSHTFKEKVIISWELSNDLKNVMKRSHTVTFLPKNSFTTPSYLATHNMFGAYEPYRRWRSESRCRSGLKSSDTFLCCEILLQSESFVCRSDKIWLRRHVLHEGAPTTLSQTPFKLRWSECFLLKRFWVQYHFKADHADTQTQSPLSTFLGSLAAVT